MAASVLRNVTLGYQPLWNPARQLEGVQLAIAPARAGDGPIATSQLLASLAEIWSGPAHAPTLLLSPQTPQLLGDLLLHAPEDGPCWLEVNHGWVADAGMAQRVRAAQQRGLRLVWRGEPGQRPAAALARCFHRLMVSLTPEEALMGLRASLHQHNGTATLLQSPVQAGQIYEAVASRALAEHCLDQQDAWAVAGWPLEDVLHGYRQQPLQPNRRAIQQLCEAINSDESLDAVERRLSEEPVLAYRFLRWANSAAVGLRTEIASLRHGLMVLGLAQLKKWLQEQLPKANSDVNLLPVRAAMVLRARLMENLLDTGSEDDLRRELYLCGLLSQIDLMLGEPLGTALPRIPLASRISSAILDGSGPYLPYLDVAMALESPHTQRTQALCNKHKLANEDVNRALLKTLANALPQTAKGLLLA